MSFRNAYVYCSHLAPNRNHGNTDTRVVSQRGACFVYVCVLSAFVSSDDHVFPINIPLVQLVQVILERRFVLVPVSTASLRTHLFIEHGFFV